MYLVDSRRIDFWRRLSWCLPVLIGFSGCGIGCGRSVPSGMVRVRGHVTHKNVPLPEGVINLEGLSERGSATGRIAPDGSFEVVLPPGEYSVAVTSKEGTVTFDEAFRPIQPKSRIPERYESVKTSGLQVNVTPRGDRLAVILGDASEEGR